MIEMDTHLLRVLRVAFSYSLFKFSPFSGWNQIERKELSVCS